jgi:hypothetical protein
LERVIRLGDLDGFFTGYDQESNCTDPNESVGGGFRDDAGNAEAKIEKRKVRKGSAAR